MHARTAAAPATTLTPFSCCRKLKYNVLSSFPETLHEFPETQSRIWPAAAVGGGHEDDLS